MSYYSKKNIEKKQWYVVNYNEFNSSVNYYYVGLNPGKMPSINKEPLTYDEAHKFRNIIRKLYNK